MRLRRGSGRTQTGKRPRNPQSAKPRKNGKRTTTTSNFIELCRNGANKRNESRGFVPLCKAWVGDHQTVKAKKVFFRQNKTKKRQSKKKKKTFLLPFHFSLTVLPLFLKMGFLRRLWVLKNSFG